MEAPNTSPDGRGYAYPHIYNTYFSMYKIAENYPELVDYREDAETYLLRAYNIFCTQNNGSVATAPTAAPWARAPFRISSRLWSRRLL